MAAPVDGYLVFSVAGDHPAVEVVRSRGVPTVVVDEPDLGEGAFVGIDDRAGARLAAEHVLSLGQRKIGVLLGRVRSDGRSGRVDEARMAEATVRIVRERLAGYRDAADAAGAELVTWEAGAMDPDAGRNAALGLLGARPDLTAVLCFSDQLAIGALQCKVLRNPAGFATDAAMALERREELMLNKRVAVIGQPVPTVPTHLIDIT